LKFKEPAWNFQVLKICKADRSDIIPRRDGINTIAGIATHVVAALEKEKREVPMELRALTKK